VKTDVPAGVSVPPLDTSSDHAGSLSALPNGEPAASFNGSTQSHTCSNNHNYHLDIY